MEIRRVIYINGRFLTQTVTGVQRYAMEIVTAFDELLCVSPRDGDATRVILLAPRSARQRIGQLGWRRVEARVVGRLEGHLWEQLELPWYARRGLLFSPGNTGPLLMRRQIATIHDAAVWAVPFAYGRAFRTWYRLLLPLLGRSVRRVLTVSEFSRKELSRHLGVHPGSVKAIWEGGDHMRRIASDEGVLLRHKLQRDRYVLAVSSLMPSKNFGRLVQALEYLGDVDFTVAIAGGYSSKVFSTQTAMQSEHITHLGYVTDGELRALYENALCFVYPSMYEGFGLPPVEAMTCGCPVIVAKAASLPEICGDAALYCDPTDPRDIARAIRLLAGNSSLRDELRAKGRIRAAELTWKACAEGVWSELSLHA